MAATSWPEKQRATVDGMGMAYVEMGEGDPIVFLHGNPTSSYLWRNIMPEVADLGRCIAPDLIGQGDSDKLPSSGPGSYRFVEHAEYLYGLLDQLGVDDKVTFVIHDWGSALGFHWLATHPGKGAGVCFMEAIVTTMRWEDWPDQARGIFQGFRSDKGEDLVLARNMFVEGVLPGSVLRTLTDEEMNEYRRPFTEPGESRRPTLTWPREIPIEGQPADVTEIVERYGRYMAEATDLPKLLVNADPGAILNGRALEVARSWPNLSEVTVKGNHFLQEDSPAEIAAALRTWYLEKVRS